MHTPISDCILSVILVGSVINWLSPYISKMFISALILDLLFAYYA